MGLRVGVSEDGLRHFLQLLDAERAVCGCSQPLTIQALHDAADALQGFCAACRDQVDLIEIGEDEVWLHLAPQ